MTEGRGADFDEQASGPLPLRPPADKPESPSAEQNQWGGPPPTASLQEFSGPPAPGAGIEAAPYQWPDQPAFRHGGPPDENTTVFDRSTAPDPTRGRGDAPGPVPPGTGLDGRAPGEPLGQGTAPTPARFEAAQPGGPRSDARGAPGQQPSAPRTVSSPRKGVPSDQYGPPWQQTSQQPVGARPEDGQGWAQDQGSAANWNYVDSIRSSELVPTRRIPPGRGWRKAVYLAQFQADQSGPVPRRAVSGRAGSQDPVPAARHLQDRRAGQGRGRQKHHRRRASGRCSPSCAKTTAWWPSTPTPRSASWPAGSTRRRRAPTGSWPPTGTCSRSPISAPGSAATRPACSCWRGSAATARRRVLDPAIYREATTQLDKHFTLSIVDCGSTPGFPGDPGGARRCRCADRGVLAVV